MFAAEIAAIHVAPTGCARHFNHVETIQQRGNALNKLARTYTTQMEVLTRYRTGGERKLTSQHLSVSEVDKLSSAT